MDSTQLSLLIILIAIVAILVARRAFRWTRYNSPYITQGKTDLLVFIMRLAVPIIVMLCFITAALLKILFPYLLAAGAAVIIVLIIRKVKKNQDNIYNRKESYTPPEKPQTIKKKAKATAAKKYKMRY